MFFLSDINSINFKRGKDKKKRKQRDDTWRRSSTSRAIGQQKGVDGKYWTKRGWIANYTPAAAILGGTTGAGLGMIAGSLIQKKPSLGGAAIGALAGTAGLGLTVHRKNAQINEYSPFYNREKAINNTLDSIIKEQRRRKNVEDREMQRRQQWNDRINAR